MAFLGTLLSSIWAKLVLAGVLLGALTLVIWRIYAAGGNAERLKTAQQDLKYILKTSKETSDADQNLANPDRARAKRVRDRFTRREGN